MQIPVGQMSFRHVKAHSAIWYSVIMLYSAAKPRLLLFAMSAAEAELIALCACAADVVYCCQNANELGFLQARPNVINEDNLGAK
jgi:hypothetical protein